MPRPKNALSIEDAGNPYNPLSAADVWEWHKQNAADAWKAAQDPQTWRDAANQYGQALLAGSVAPGSGPMGKALTSIAEDGAVLMNGTRVGHVKLDPGDNSMRIANIEIHPSYQNQGLGSDVIRQIQAQASDQGLPVTLTTDAMRGKEAQIAQRRLYERLGFIPNVGDNQVFERVGRKKSRKRWCGIRRHRINRPGRFPVRLSVSIHERNHRTRTAASR